MLPDEIDEDRALRFMAEFDEFDNLCHDMSVNARASHRDKIGMIRRLERMWLLVNPVDVDLDDEPEIPEAANEPLPATERQAFRVIVDTWLGHMDELLEDIDDLQFNHSKVWALHAIWEHVRQMLELVGSDLLAVPDLSNPHTLSEATWLQFRPTSSGSDQLLHWGPGTCPGCNEVAVHEDEALCGACSIRLAPPSVSTSSTERGGDPSSALVRRWIGACNECDPARYYSLLLSISAARPDLWCRACRTPVFLERMQGQYSLSHLCSQRCRWAIGAKCRCSCGGVNHGRRYSLN